jgi:glutamate-1-semialdehyde 2,1-aminomutase
MPIDYEKAFTCLAAEWEKKAPTSRSLFARAAKLMPSGVAHDMRSRSFFSPYYASAKGAFKLDVDGNRYLDLWMGHGSLLLGHARDEVVQAIVEAAPLSTHLGGCHPAEIELAEQVLKLVPSLDRIRFTMSGTEASMLAIRLARAATGRPGIIKFIEHFHGWHDYACAGRQPPYTIPLGGGLTPGVCEDMIVCPQNDLEHVTRILDSYAGVAAVIMEPTGAHGGQGPIDPQFVKALRELTRARGVLLIFDETVTGFRVDAGGAQKLLGIEADLVVYGKILFGGLPGAAVAGTEKVMSLLEFSDNRFRNRYSKVYHNGTHNANPCSARCGIATLAIIAAESANRTAAQNADELMRRTNEIFEAEKLPFIFYGGESIIHLACAFDEELKTRAEKHGLPSISAELLESCPPVRKLFDLALLINGVDLPTGGQAWVSTAHGEEATAYFVEAVKKSIAQLRTVGALE